MEPPEAPGVTVIEDYCGGLLKSRTARLTSPLTMPIPLCGTLKYQRQTSPKTHGSCGLLPIEHTHMFNAENIHSLLWCWVLAKTRWHGLENAWWLIGGKRELQAVYFILSVRLYSDISLCQWKCCSHADTHKLSTRCTVKHADLTARTNPC